MVSSVVQSAAVRRVRNGGCGLVIISLLKWLQCIYSVYRYQSYKVATGRALEEEKNRIEKRSEDNDRTN